MSSSELEIKREYERLWRFAFPEKHQIRKRKWRVRHLEMARASERRMRHDRYWSRPLFYRRKGKLAARQQRIRNPETGRRAFRKYRAANEGVLYMYDVLSRLAFPSRRREIRRRCNRKHIEAYRKASRERKRRNRARHTMLENTRRARKLSSTTGDLAAIHKVYSRAAELRKWFAVVVDHIVPISKGGEHSPNNLQIIYDSENAAKGIRMDYRPSVIFS